jgi:hypothetical protein
MDWVRGGHDWPHRERSRFGLGPMAHGEQPEQVLREMQSIIGQSVFAPDA